MAQMYKVFYNLQTLIFAEEFPEVSAINYDHKAVIIRNIDHDLNAIRQHMAPSKPSTLYIADPGFDTYKRLFEPFYYPVIAAGGLVQNEQRELLMIRRYNMWDLPKGKAEPQEEPLKCAMREVEEETGVSCQVISKVPFLTRHIYQRNNRWDLKTTHWFKMIPSSTYAFSPQIEEGITEILWMPATRILDEQRNDTWPLVREVILNLSE